jgi:hypothetical protein
MRVDLVRSVSAALPPYMGIIPFQHILLGKYGQFDKLVTSTSTEATSLDWKITVCGKSQCSATCSQYEVNLPDLFVRIQVLPIWSKFTWLVRKDPSSPNMTEIYLSGSLWAQCSLHDRNLTTGVLESQYSQFSRKFTWLVRWDPSAPNMTKFTWVVRWDPSAPNMTEI